MVQESAVLMSGSRSSQHVTMYSRSRSSQCITMWSRSSQPVTMWSRSRSSQPVTMFFTLTLVLSCCVGQGSTFSLSELSQLAGVDLPTLLSGSNYKLVGEEIELTCVLNQKALDNNFTSGDIFFMHSNMTAYSQRQCIPPSFVHIVNTTTSTLRLPNVTLANAGEYSCYVDTLPCKAGRQLEMIASTDVQVQYGPQNVTNMRCVVYEMETMTCTWQHPVSYNMKNTTVSVYYNSDPSMPSNIAPCPQLSTDSCIWDSNTFRSVPYHIVINVTNIVRNSTASSHFTIDVNQILKLAPVEGLTLSPSSSQDCYTLTWTSKSLFTSTCIIKHTSKGHTNIKENVEDKRFELCGLKPYTSHSFSVSCTPSGLHSGFPSDPALYEYTTPEKAPDVGPNITNGSYNSVTCNTGRKNITVYWKQVPEFARNGVIKNYIIDTGNMTEEVDAGKFEATVETDCNTSVIQLFAVNGAGMSTTPSVLQISNLTVPPNVEKTFSVFRNDENKTFQAVWESEKDNSTYTIFWCFRTSTSPSCQSEMFWSLVPASLSDVEIPEPNLSPLIRVGISVFDGRQASGIFWAECSYIQNPNTVPAPVNLVAIPKQSSALLYWNPAGCEENAVKVTEYLVKFGKDGGKANDYSTQIVPGDRNKFELSDLETDINYTIRVQSVFNSKPGEEAVTSVKISPPDDSSMNIIIPTASVLASVIFFLLLVYFSIYCVRKTLQSRAKFKDLSSNPSLEADEGVALRSVSTESSSTSDQATHSTAQLIQQPVRQGIQQSVRQGIQQSVRQGIQQSVRQGIQPSSRAQLIQNQAYNPVQTHSSSPTHSFRLVTDNTLFIEPIQSIPPIESIPPIQSIPHPVQDSDNPNSSSGADMEQYLKMYTKPDTSQEYAGPQTHVNTAPAAPAVHVVMHVAAGALPHGPATAECEDYMHITMEDVDRSLDVTDLSAISPAVVGHTTQVTSAQVTSAQVSSGQVTSAQVSSAQSLSNPSISPTQLQPSDNLYVALLPALPSDPQNITNRPPVIDPQNITHRPPVIDPQNITNRPPVIDPQNITHRPPVIDPQNITHRPPDPQNITHLPPVIDSQNITNRPPDPQNITNRPPVTDSQNITNRPPDPQNITNRPPVIDPQNITQGPLALDHPDYLPIPPTGFVNQGQQAANSSDSFSSFHSSTDSSVSSSGHFDYV